MRRLAVLTGLAGLLFASAPCAAAVTYTYVYKDRSVLAEERTSGAGYDWVWSEDLAPFSVDITGHGAEFSLMHQSRLDPEGITFTSHVMGGAGSRTAGTWHRVTSLSKVNVIFETDTDSPFIASISASGTGDWSLISRLTSVPDNAVIYSGTGWITGDLPAGVYRFEAYIEATGLRWFDPDSGWEMSAPSTATINAMLTIPGPATLSMLGVMLIATRRRRG